jgi:hypothetical protein
MSAHWKTLLDPLQWYIVLEIKEEALLAIPWGSPRYSCGHRGIRCRSAATKRLEARNVSGVVSGVDGHLLWILERMFVSPTIGRLGN